MKAKLQEKTDLVIYLKQNKKLDIQKSLHLYTGKKTAEKHV